MSLEVRTGSGTGFELLLAAAAVADSDWRDVFTHGQAAYDDVRRADPGLVPTARRFGRFGWINLVGLLAERRWDRFSLFVNGENLTGVRQSRWDPLLVPAQGADGRWTVDAWAPLEGRVVNGGVRLRF